MEFNRYNKVHCTVFDKNGTITEYNINYDILRIIGWDNYWHVTIYGNFGEPLVDIDDDMTWTRYHGSRKDRPLKVEYSSGMYEQYKYHDNGNVLYHEKGYPDGTTIKYYYNEKGNLIAKEIEEE